MQHVDLQVQQPDGLQHGAAEEDEPLAVVDVVLAVDAVQLVAVEVLVLLDQVDRHLAAGHGAAQQMAGDHLAADGNDEVDPQRLDRLAAIAGLAVGGQDHRRLMAQPGQLDRQRPADVGQSAGLGKRHRFARGQQDVHGDSLRSTYVWVVGQLYCQPRQAQGGRELPPGTHPTVIIADLRVGTKGRIGAIVNPCHKTAASVTFNKYPILYASCQDNTVADSPAYGIVTIGTSAAADEFFPRMG